MSRVANNPVQLPSGVEVKLNGADVTVKGSKGTLELSVVDGIQISQDDNVLTFLYESDKFKAMAGTTRALVNNMVKGVSEGWEKKLVLNGVGYRAALQGQGLQLNLGYSHDVVYAIPQGIDIKVPKPTEIVVSGIDKQRVGQVASEIRAWRPPEPYKGKGVKYADETIFRKEGKKK